MTPKISLLIITFNKVSYLRGTLLSLESLDFPTADFEVVVVDDGSSDGTAAFLDEFEPRYALCPVRQDNAGRAVARNTSIAHARGALLVILDDDFLMQPDSLTHLWAAHLANPDHILISTLNHIAVAHVPQLLDGIVRDAYIPWPDLDNFAPVGEQYALADLRRRMLVRGIEGFSVPWLAAQGMSVSIPQTVCAALEGYDPRFTAYGMEDFDLGYRFFESEGKFTWVRQSLLFHLDHGHNRTVLFKESTVTTRAFYEKFHDRAEIKQFIRFLCGAISFRDLNNFVAKQKGLPEIDGFNLRFSPFGMIRYRDQQLGAPESTSPAALQYTKAQQFRLRFLIERISRDIEPEIATPGLFAPMAIQAGKSVLVVAPHMDDEVIGCGGLVAEYSRAGSTVTMLYLTDGAMRNIRPDTYPQLCRDRRVESECAADMLGAERCIYLAIPERNLVAAAQDPAPIIRVLRECRPDIVLVPGEHEHHPDHRVAHAWLRAALHAEPELAPSQLICYEVWGSCRPNRLLQLDAAAWERKVGALAMYQTQLQDLNYQQMMAYLNGTRGACGPQPVPGGRAEAYRCIDLTEPAL